MSLIVPIDGVNYVADVGYGDLPISAMPLIIKIVMQSLRILTENIVPFM